MKYPFIGKWTPSTTSRFLLASTIVGLPLGCTPEKKDTEVSAATSGFRPAESGTGKSSTVNSTASSSDSKGQGTPSKGGEQPEAAPPLPSFTPGQLDPAVAAKSYMILSMPKTLALEEIAPFIRSIDRAMQDLQKDVSQRLVNNEIVLNRGMDQIGRAHV